jgi:LCP family protein required for cell wall assembly
MKKKKIDYYRILAILIILFSLLYFYLNIFFPRLIFSPFRLGTIRRPLTVLLLGTDTTFDVVTGKPMPGSEGRTDTVILARFDPIRDKLFMLSIPRDSYLAIPGYGMQKINAANVYGGIDLLKETLSDLTGIKIDYYLAVNPAAAIKMVNLLGGIEIDVEKDLYYVDRAQNLYINLKMGKHKLSGEEAQGYIRFRHDAEGDIGRIERQQKFLRALFLAFAKPVNLYKVPIGIQLALGSIKTDLPLAKTIRLLNFARMITPARTIATTAPGEAGLSESAGSIWLLNRIELDKIIKDHF